MKRLALAVVLASLSSHTFAGGPVQPEMEPVIVEQDAASSGAGVIVPLMLLLVVAAVAST